jgi:hypothetical protein
LVFFVIPFYFLNLFHGFGNFSNITGLKAVRKNMKFLEERLSA